MSANKKKNIESMDQDPSDDSETESDNEGPHPDAYTGNEEIQVDFEGRSPTDTDFHGISQLFHQLFLKAHINVNEMAEIVIAQNYVGSVIFQSEIEGEEEDPEDDDMYDSNMIFGITTAINMTAKKDKQCIEQLRSYIISKAEKHATDATLVHLRDVLANEARPVGFLINERFINIPPQISVPLLENLHKEIKQANEKKMPFGFVYFIMIIKFHRREAKKNKPQEDVYVNAEEEVIAKQAVQSFEFSVAGECDSGLTGNWLEEDDALTPYRKIVLFDATKLPLLIDSIQTFINNE
ncbi:protein BCCIP homolog [Eupeodes corollae]|uniref:protein BCCIP homolog n=1 Tax=Eupeodes corollae TaxID=290404 RepID=UPI002492FBA1|nr:protein BCCIP homolog [Eupeodes corollae]